MHTEAHMISDETEAEGIVHLAQETGSKTYQWFTLACGDAYLFFQCVVMVYWLTWSQAIVAEPTAWAGVVNAINTETGATPPTP